MNILTNICNPKDEHFEQEARTQTYKPLNDYVFENRAMQKMRARYEAPNNPEEFKYQSWNHPYSISNYFMMQKGNPSSVMTPTTKQSLNAGSQEYLNFNSNQSDILRQNGNKKISFKEIPQALCGIGNKEEEGEKVFIKRDDYYGSIRGLDQSRNDYQMGSRYYYNNQHEEQQVMRKSREEPHQQAYMANTNFSHSLWSKELLQLKQQNKELKRIIQEEYKPMKELYNKLLTEQEQRQYLISKLEWKVRELVKEMGGYANHNVGKNQNFVENKNEPKSANPPQNQKVMVRVDSEKHMNISGVQSHIAYKLNSLPVTQNRGNNLPHNYLSPTKNYNDQIYTTNGANFSTNFQGIPPQIVSPNKEPLNPIKANFTSNQQFYVPTPQPSSYQNQGTYTQNFQQNHYQTSMPSSLPTFNQKPSNNISAPSFQNPSSQNFINSNNRIYV